MSRVRPSGGFTLLEMLVVLTIVGLLAGVALPRLENVMASVKRDGQRKTLEAAINGLGYRAYASGKVIELGKPAADQASPPLEVPPGWRIKVSEPILYAVNGVCGGGRLAIIDPTGRRENFVLKPPKCRLQADTGE